MGAAAEGVAQAMLEPMFDISWAAFLASWSRLLQTSEDLRVVTLCLRGIRSCIHIAGVLGLEKERSALVMALAQFTGLDTLVLRELQPRNIES